MSAGSLCRSILHVSGCRIQLFLCHRSAFVDISRPTVVCSRILSCKSGSELRLFDHPKVEVNRKRVISTRSSANIARSAGNNVGHEFLDGTEKARTSSSKFALEKFGSIIFSDAEQTVLGGQASNQHVNMFVMDLETTGLYVKTGRMIEIAFRCVSGGKNSCFQSLVNPEQHVPNSRIHGITTSMVNNPDVPRMEDLIPILMQYITSRQIDGGVCLFVAHNARGFDVPWLINEFSRCSVDIPSDWLFLDTLPLARELKRSNGLNVPSKASLQGLREYYEIPLQGSAHRAMADVHLLTEILERLACDLNLTISDLLGRAFKASDLIYEGKKRLKSR